MPPRGRPGLCGLKFLLRGPAFGGELVDFCLLLTKVGLRLGERYDRGVLTGLSLLDGLIGVMFGQLRRRIPCGRLGVRLLRVCHRLLRAQRQRLQGRGGGK